MQSPWTATSYNEPYNEPEALATDESHPSLTLPARHTLILKHECYVFDFAPNRALRQIADYGSTVGDRRHDRRNSGSAELIGFLPVLAYDGAGDDVNWTPRPSWIRCHSRHERRRCWPSGGRACCW